MHVAEIYQEHRSFVYRCRRLVIVLSCIWIGNDFIMTFVMQSYNFKYAIAILHAYLRKIYHISNHKISHNYLPSKVINNLSLFKLIKVQQAKLSFSNNHYNYENEVHAGQWFSHMLFKSIPELCKVYIMFNFHCLFYEFVVCIDKPFYS